jgi:hypothetical protein
MKEKNVDSPWLVMKTKSANTLASLGPILARIEMQGLIYRQCNMFRLTRVDLDWLRGQRALTAASSAPLYPLLHIKIECARTHSLSLIGPN